MHLKFDFVDLISCFDFRRFCFSCFTEPIFCHLKEIKDSNFIGQISNTIKIFIIGQRNFHHQQRWKISKFFVAQRNHCSGCEKVRKGIWRLHNVLCVYFGECGYFGSIFFPSLMYLGNIKEGSNHNFKVNYKFVGREDEIPKFDLSVKRRVWSLKFNDYIKQPVKFTKSKNQIKIGGDR